MAKRNKKLFNSFVQPQLSNASKTLLANIRFAAIDYDIKTLVVTSTNENEGKTVVSCNLANAIATSGKSVLLVEADMRRRTIGSLLGVHPKYGIYSVMAGEASLDDAIVSTEVQNLYFLDAEPNIPNPSDILSTKRFASLVEALSGMFDYVVFDTPPVSLFIDSAVLSSLVDGTILAVRQRHTKRADLTKVSDQLRAANANLLGVVMTFMPTEEHEYYYAYYTQDGKRTNRDELAKQTVPDSISNGGATKWESRLKPRTQVPTSAPASTVAPASHTTSAPARTAARPVRTARPAEKPVVPAASNPAIRPAGVSDVRPVNPATAKYAPGAYKQRGRDKKQPRHGKLF